MSAILVFDLETAPDADDLRRVYNLPAALADEAVVEMAERLRRQQKGSDFMPPHLQRVVAIGCLLRLPDSRPAEKRLRLGCLPNDKAEPTDEAAAIRQFFDIIEQYKPTLVSWNGGGFDLPTLNHRALKHGVCAPAYWNTNDADFRWNNYVNRYHERHTDLMDALALRNNRAWAPLDELAKVCGLPGKKGIGGAQVGREWRRGNINAIRDYCLADVVLTYLLYLRFQHFRGQCGDIQLEYAAVRAMLADEGDFWRDFLDAWRDDSP